MSFFSSERDKHILATLCVGSPVFWLFLSQGATPSALRSAHPQDFWPQLWQNVVLYCCTLILVGFLSAFVLAEKMGQSEEQHRAREERQRLGRRRLGWNVWKFLVAVGVAARLMSFQFHLSSPHLSILYHLGVAILLSTVAAIFHVLWISCVDRVAERKYQSRTCSGTHSHDSALHRSACVD